MTVHTAPHRHASIFFMIKPDGVPHEHAIMQMIEPLATVIARRPFDPADMNRVERLYAVHRDKPFYPRLMDYFRGMPVIAYLLQERAEMACENGFYASFIELVGDTDPAQARPGTIRSLSTDSLQKSRSEKRALRNLVHRSTTPEETRSEAALFFWDFVLDNAKVKGSPGVLGISLARAGEGTFFEERVQSALRRCRFLSAEEEMIWYQDYCGRQGDPPEEGRALVETKVRDTRILKELTSPLMSSLINGNKH